MNSPGPALTIALYSEDRTDAGSDFAVLREIVYGMLQQVSAGLKTNHVKLEPAQPVRAERVSGSYWKVTARAEAGAQERRRRLIRDVAAALRLGRVVVFHVDADEVWSRRGQCANVHEHWLRFARDIQATLIHAGYPVDESALRHTLIEAIAFSEIESWAFANVARLRELLVDPRDLAVLERWEGDLGVLDETPHIKDALTIRDAHNRDLVQRRQGFLAAALVMVDKSYATVVRRLRASPVVSRGIAEAAARPF